MTLNQGTEPWGSHYDPRGHTHKRGNKMNKEKSSVKTAVLIIAFIPSLTLFWNIVTVVNGPSKFYPTYQFLFATYYTLLSIFLTDDIHHFNDFWRKHPYLRCVFEKVLHYSASVISWIMHLCILIPALISVHNTDTEIAECKQSAALQIKQYDAAPLEVRAILPAGALSLVMIILVGFDILPESVVSWIQEILNTLVSVVGLWFVIINAKEKKEDNRS